MNNTGRASGSLSPIIYFERSDGYVILPAYETGDPSLAVRVFNERYKNHPTEKWQWCETGTSLADVDRLQTRLTDQLARKNGHMADVNGMMREQVRKMVGDNLRQKMVSSSTSAYERDFIQAYLQLREDKRDKYRDNLMHYNAYLWAREMGSGTKIEDRMPPQEGEFYRTEAQQK